MFQSNVINSEDGPDLCGFKGIFMRYARRYVLDLNKPGIVPWLQLNAKVAYNNRDTSNIIGTLWGNRASDTSQYTAFSASTAVSLMINCPLSTSITKNPYATVEAENFDYLKGILVEPTTDGNGGYQVDGIQDGYYTAYMNVDFGSTGATSVDFRVSSATAGGTIEIRLGGITGTLIGSATAPGTGDWATYTTVTIPVTLTKGLQNVYLVYKGSGYLFNINYFKFYQANTAIASVKQTSSPKSIALSLNETGTQLHANLFGQFARNLSISTMRGKTAYCGGMTSSPNLSIDVSQFPRGVYVVTVETNQWKMSEKVLLK
jgi:hypothetical protein